MKQASPFSLRFQVWGVGGGFVGRGHSVNSGWWSWFVQTKLRWLAVNYRCCCVPCVYISGLLRFSSSASIYCHEGGQALGSKGWSECATKAKMQHVVSSFGCALWRITEGEIECKGRWKRRGQGTLNNPPWNAARKHGCPEVVSSLDTFNSLPKQHDMSTSNGSSWMNQTLKLMILDN